MNELKILRICDGRLVNIPEILQRPMVDDYALAHSGCA
jgi:hypothetical protein